LQSRILKGEQSSLLMRIAGIEPPVCDSLTLLVAACAACGGFGFARNTATFDVFFWLQVTNFDVLLNSAPPNGPDYIDIFGLRLHAQLFRKQRSL